MEQINTRALWLKLRELVLEQAGSGEPGKEKYKQVVHLAAVWVARQTPLPDLIEVPVYRTLLLIPVQIAYDHLKDAGEV